MLNSHYLSLQQQLSSCGTHGAAAHGRSKLLAVWPRQAAIQELGEKVRISEAVLVTFAYNLPGQIKGLAMGGAAGLIHVRA